MDLPGWAVRGAKVVCIESEDWGELRGMVNDPAGLLTYPRRNNVYTLREVRIRYVPECGEVLIGVLLEEIVNPVCSAGSAGGEEGSWDIRAFAPLLASRKRADASVPELVS